ncbi:MAG: photosynthetic complex putative assembly protein PuhB [Hydrogenophaga sp.]
MPIESHGHEHEFEPQYGLPELLPANERILWQGSPDFGAVARRIFHLRKVAVYFALMLAWSVASTMGDGGSFVDGLKANALLSFLAVMGFAALTGLAWATARTAVYTITDKRIVMRIGIALTLTFNLPLRLVTSASLRQHKDGCGDILIAMGGQDHIAWLHLWPHVRPWVLARPEPMLRAVPNAEHVAALLSQAWSATTGVAVTADAPTATGVAAVPESASSAPGQRWQVSPT